MTRLLGALVLSLLLVGCGDGSGESSDAQSSTSRGFVQSERCRTEAGPARDLLQAFEADLRAKETVDLEAVDGKIAALNAVVAGPRAYCTDAVNAQLTASGKALERASRALSTCPNVACVKAEAPVLNVVTESHRFYDALDAVK